MALVTVGLAGALAFTWWPNGEYRPIQPGERGTVTDAIEAVESVGTGRPGLTPETEEELDGAPSQAWDLSDGPDRGGAPAGGGRRRPADAGRRPVPVAHHHRSPRKPTTSAVLDTVPPTTTAG